MFRTIISSTRVGAAATSTSTSLPLSRAAQQQAKAKAPVVASRSKTSFARPSSSLPGLVPTSTSTTYAFGFTRTISSTRPSASPRRPAAADWRTMAEQDITKYLRQTHDRVFECNRAWAAEQKSKNPDFFATLSEGQNPEYLWIGCSDSRIPAEQITGLEAGDAFVHRNIANLVCNTDLNVMSVITYAVQHLKVKHIVVCGHYGCGGVKAAMTPKDMGLLNPWLRNIRDVYRLHEKELDAIADEDARYNRLVELNVIEQCRNVIKTASVQQSYAENRFPIVHGWVFGFHDGLLKDLQFDHEKVLKDIQKVYNLTG
ncbi:carbonic anhydrase [Cercophora newfieldiana]|uniref:Carbonic anhydrase n=1 Tax=Cercophora newfieldiana TaxID=92897 RepID=A0AA39YC16_9PEZI|nr:carbonic anhydrase [Cercophora newfieldiana]